MPKLPDEVREAIEELVTYICYYELGDHECLIHPILALSKWSGIKRVKESLTRLQPREDHH